jgi:hypothetical protein
MLPVAGNGSGGNCLSVVLIEQTAQMCPPSHLTKSCVDRIGARGRRAQLTAAVRALLDGMPPISDAPEHGANPAPSRVEQAVPPKLTVAGDRADPR